MPKQGLLKSGSYTCLNEVYRLTTVQQKKHDKFKSVLQVGVAARKKLMVLFNQQQTEMNEGLTDVAAIDIAVSREYNMPTNNTEEAALLGVAGVLAVDSMDDIELKSIQLQFPAARRFSEGGCAETRVRTDRGDLLVAVAGDRSKPAIFTYHDLGLNYLCFQSFFNFAEMRALLENFCVYHVNAPGQEEAAPNLPDDYVYPSMDELANQINYVMGHFGVRSFIGFGVGLGANVLARFALAHPTKVEALCVINCSASQAGWIEWAYQKMNTRSLKYHGMTQTVLDYLMWHHFGRDNGTQASDLSSVYRAYWARHTNPHNLSLLVDSAARRGELSIARSGRTLEVPVLSVTGSRSAHVDSALAFNAKLPPATSAWLKISDCGMVLEEQPGKVAEAFRLFLQGEGYVAPLSPSKIAVLCGATGGAGGGATGGAGSGAGGRRCRTRVMRITENPISEAAAC